MFRSVFYWFIFVLDLQVLKRHMKSHLESKLKVCQHCGEKFSDCTSFKKHLIIHENNTQR